MSLSGFLPPFLIPVSDFHHIMVVLFLSSKRAPGTKEAKMSSFYSAEGLRSVVSLLDGDM